ncbi:hypothetical protein [Vibrio rotiferianus]|uniref:hypothetical protein n=1 Tax=Vibrio rotiferianus TaxID=190895 RepID=UPI0039095CB2
MLRIFNLSFFLGLILSIVGSSGVGLFRSLTQELAGVVTFNLLVHIIFSISGTIGLLSYFNFGYRVVSLVRVLSNKLYKVFFPIASALLGMILGVIIYAMITNEWETVLKGSFLMLLVWGHVWVSTGHLRQSIYYLNRKVKNDKNEALAIFMVSCLLLATGSAGIWRMLSKSYT